MISTALMDKSSMNCNGKTEAAMSLGPAMDFHLQEIKKYNNSRREREGVKEFLLVQPQPPFVLLS
jgi:hypothetical protein